MLKNSSELFKLYKISHTLKLWDIWINSSELWKLDKISHTLLRDVSWFTLTILTKLNVLTENLKKYHSLTHFLTHLSDNLKARDASTSKNFGIQTQQNKNIKHKNLLQHFVHFFTPESSSEKFSSLRYSQNF